MEQISKSSFSVQAKVMGPKKQVRDAKELVDNIRELELSKSFSTGKVCFSCGVLCDYYMAGGNMKYRDSQTGETFLHVLCDYIHLYLSANGTRIVYLVSTKLDLDLTDHNGDTVLHKVVRVTGAWRVIVALMRCGACPLIKNKAGRTPEEEILHLKNPGWEENLHWLRKYLPGLWAAVKAKNPDPVLIERLLRYWCRTVKVVGTETENLKCQVHMCDTQLDLVCTLEKYENTNEMALAMLSGKSKFIDMWKSEDNLQKVDVNTKDHSYQFYYRDYPTAPRPLLAAVWEIDQLDLIQAFMELNPDTSVKYTFESEAASPPKPLFFQLVNPKSRPQNEAITEHILRYSNLKIRNLHGQTVLVEAMYNGETEGVIRVILNSGVNVGARDAMGRTAWDHCGILNRQDYRELIDSHVIELIQDCDLERLEALVLQLYDHVMPPSTKVHILNLVRQKGSKQLAELLKNIDSKQAIVRKLFSLVKSGNKSQLVKLMSRKYGCARDKAGRTLLHYAIQHSFEHLSQNTSEKKREMSNNTHSSKISISSQEHIILSDIHISHKDGSDIDVQRSNIMEQNQKQLIRDMRRDCGKKPNCLKHKLCPEIYFTVDFLGIIKYLVQEYPGMLSVTNNLGQTPLHYAHIFCASKEVIDLLEKCGTCSNVKDVYDFVPEDYSRFQCGEQTFRVRRQPTVSLDLDIFLTETDFEVKFQQAIQEGDLDTVKKLVSPLMEHGGETKFSNVLFDCLDQGHVEIASYLVESGFHTDIAKQYEVCDPDDPMCAMMECSHAVTSFRQHAVDVGATDLVRLIDRLSVETVLG